MAQVFSISIMKSGMGRIFLRMSQSTHMFMDIYLKFNPYKKGRLVSKNKLDAFGSTCI